MFFGSSGPATKVAEMKALLFFRKSATMDILTIQVVKIGGFKHVKSSSCDLSCYRKWRCQRWQAALRFDQQQLCVANHALDKTRLAITQIKLPHADEGFRVTQCPDRIQLRVKVIVPQAQGGGVVRADVFEMRQPQVRHARQRITDGRDRRYTTAGKNITLNEIYAVFRHFVLLIRDGDRLQQHRAFGLEQLAALAKIGVVVVMAHRFDHFDRYQLVVLAATGTKITAIR